MDKFSNSGSFVLGFLVLFYLLIGSFFLFFQRWFLVISMTDLGLSLNILLKCVSWQHSQHGVVGPKEEESFNNWLIMLSATEKNIN